MNAQVRHRLEKSQAEIKPTVVDTTTTSTKHSDNTNMTSMANKSHEDAASHNVKEEDQDSKKNDLRV